MKVCYVDESGLQDSDPVLIMVGIVADTYNLHRTAREFGEIFDQIQGFFEENLKELKGSKMIFGRDRWRKVDPELRGEIVDYLCDWVVERKHNLVLSAIEKSRHQAADFTAVPRSMRDPWLAAALHLALQTQKAHQGMEKNKGKTFLIFDENKAQVDKLAELLWDPPAWTDDFYARGKTQDRLDQVIDTALYAKSHHVGLVQVADVFAFLFRRYAELRQGTEEVFAGDRELVEASVNKLATRLSPRSTRWPKRSSSKCAGWYVSVAPDALLELGT